MKFHKKKTRTAQKKTLKICKRYLHKRTSKSLVYNLSNNAYDDISSFLKIGDSLIHFYNLNLKKKLEQNVKKTETFEQNYIFVKNINSLRVCISEDYYLYSTVIFTGFHFTF